MNNIFYGGNIILSHEKIKEELKNHKLRKIYCEKMLDKLLKGNIYSYVTYHKYHKLELINNYIVMYYKYLELNKSVLKGMYALKELYLIDDLVELIGINLKNILKK
tara:strand:- start:620 stop:937 length:318 start_codon:yes stop_codon:yes gene_type:complete